MSKSLQEVIQELASRHNVTTDFLQSLSERVKDEVVLPILKQKNIIYDDSYVEALVAMILAIYFDEGGRIQAYEL